VVSIAVPPSSNGGPSLNIWEILIGVGIVAVAAGGVTYYVKKRLNKARVEDFAWCRLSCGSGKNWERDVTDHGRAFNPETGQNAHWDDDKGQWIDSKTGEGLTPSVWESGPAGK
jgi:hypothetical protein